MDDLGDHMAASSLPGDDLADLDVAGLAGPGRRAKPLVPVVVRPLQGADLALLAVARGTRPVQLKKLSERHHGLARCIAGGMKPSEAAIAMGYDLARVSVLQDDPAFAELISFYREKLDAEFIDTSAAMSGLAKDIVNELRDRLEEDPDQFDIRELRETAKIMLDRSGHGPTRTENTNINVNLSNRLEAARQRALEAARASARGEVIDAEVVEIAAE